MRDNDDRIGATRRVPVAEAASAVATIPFWDASLTNNPSKIAAKSLVLEDFSYKSFKPKDLAEFFT
jgi:hypothetical protein